MKNHITVVGFQFSIVALLFALSACSDDKGEKKDGGGKSKITVLENAVQTQMACDDFRDTVFEHYQNQINESGSVPAVSTTGSTLQIETEALLLEKVAAVMKPNNAEEHRRILGALMVGDRTTPEAESMQKELTALFEKWRQYFELNKITCASMKAAAEFTPTEAQQEAMQLQVPLQVWGVRKAFATAYQSCQSLRLRPLVRRSPDLEGIETGGTYPGGKGKYNKVTDKAALVRSHYYVRDFQSAPGCVDVKKYPMVYDFGGKPYVGSSDPKAVLNYWKDNPTTGSRGVGIDCSGYVFSALAAGGLRLREGKVMKAAETANYPAAMYMDPANGFSCLKKVSMGKSGTILPGDIFASTGHVTMVESVGDDPLAIEKYSECNQITYRDFDFIISQSSPEQNRIGINMYEAREYLGPLTKLYFRNGLEKYAREACRAYQSGKNVTTTSKTFSITRHKMTAACLQPEIRLESQSCIDKCNELLR